MIRLTVIEKYVKSSTRPTITVADVALSLEERYQWIFCGLILKIWQCNLDPIDIVVQSESHPNHTGHMVENPEIVIHNSSFSNLDLSPGSKAQITDCYIDAQFKPRPTLITANNSDVSIQNCHFGNFINEDDSTILYGHNNSNIAIKKSVFIQHNSSKGILFLHNNSSMRISGSSISKNIASSPGYSSITLQDRIHADVHDIVFRNNSALVGGAIIARDQCRVTLINSTFSSNKAIIGKTSNNLKNSKVRRAARILDQNTIRLYSPISPTLFNQTSLGDKKRKVIAPRLLVKSSILKKISVQLEGTLLELYPGQGGAIYVETQSQLLVTNCTFEDNSAQTWGGAIITVFNVTLRVQETTFVGNKAQYGGAILGALNATVHIEETTFVGNKAPGTGGAINIQHQSQLLVTNCTFKDNSAQITAGTISAGYNTTLRVQETTFVGNKAQYLGGAILATLNATVHIEETTFVGNKAPGGGGAINIQQQAHLRMKRCLFEDNISELQGGAISAGLNATLEVKTTNFTRNRAGHEGGAIAVGQQAYLHTTDCIFKDNRAEQIGGAIAGAIQAVLEINGSYFSKNGAFEGGAINVQQQANLSLTNCRLERNFASDTGGAVLSSTSVVLKIQETNFTGNSARHGGALYVSTLTDYHVVQSVFNWNTAKGSGGAVCMESKTSLQVEFTNFANNEATDGGAIHIQENSKLQTNMCNFWKNLAKTVGGAIVLKGYSSAVIEICYFLSNHAAYGGAVSAIEPEHLSVLSTSLMRNVASATGGAISITNGTGVIINNITCVGNQGPNSGGCLAIDFVTLTLNNSNISENFAHLFGAGVATSYSRTQVGARYTNEARYMCYFNCKYHRCGSLFYMRCSHFQYNKGQFCILGITHALSWKLSDFFSQMYGTYYICNSKNKWNIRFHFCD